MSNLVQQRPIRAGVFNAIEQAQLAVKQLLEIGFTKDQITVVCSDRETERQFHDFEHQEPAGFYTRGAMAWGAVIGAALGCAIAVVAILIAGLPELFAIAVLAAVTGGVLGAFVGAMGTQAVEKELANFYDQEVMPGQILVAAEDHSQRADQTLLRAADVLASTGATPIQLPEG